MGRLKKSKSQDYCKCSRDPILLVAMVWEHYLNSNDERYETQLAIDIVTSHALFAIKQSKHS